MKQLEVAKNLFSKEEVYFYPWIGENYYQSKLKILILGESHYGGDNKKPERELTYHCINEVQSGVWKNKFFTKVKNICSTIGSPIAHDIFWNQASFYNFVQEIVGNKARIRPTASMWNKSKEPFLEVCKQLKPDIILVLGKELTNQMANLGLLSNIIPETTFDKKYNLGEIQYSSEKKCKCICITHPSSPKFGKIIGWQNVLNGYLK